MFSGLICDYVAGPFCSIGEALIAFSWLTWLTLTWLIVLAVCQVRNGTKWDQPFVGSGTSELPMTATPVAHAPAAGASAAVAPATQA